MPVRKPRRPSGAKLKATEITQVVGGRIQALRIERGWSLVDLAGRATTSRRELLHVEAGERSPSLLTLEKLARAFHVPIGTFFDSEAPRGSAPPQSRALLHLIARLRERPNEELAAIGKVIDALDHAAERLAAAHRSRR